MLKRRSKHNLSFQNTLSFDMGQLVPVCTQEVNPGDTLEIQSTAVLRTAPLLAPIMHNVDAFMHWFFVPHRITFDEWEPFITKGFDGTTVVPFPVMRTPEEGYGINTLADYLDVPTNFSYIDENGVRQEVVIGNFEFSALRFRAYAQIINDYYLNENFQEYLPLDKGSGLDTTTNTELKNRNWRKDYFTAMLPTQQRGPVVTMPLGTTAPTLWSATNSVTGEQEEINPSLCFTLGGGAPHRFFGPDVNPGFPNEGQPYAQLNVKADLSNASLFTLPALYLATAVQNWMQKNNRGGVRLIEFILEHFGVKSSDARLQRAEYLGGGKAPIIVSEVLQTSSTDSTSPQGNMSGHGYTIQGMPRIKKSFEEHGYVMCIMSVMPKTAYMQGCPADLNRRTPYDFFFPSFAHLAFRGVPVKEVYAGASNPEATFGYTGIYDEFRQNLDKIHGEFKESLLYWNMARKFNSEPALNEEFINADPTKRIFPVTNEPGIYAEIFHNIISTSLVPKRAEPRL